jgi:hypothetical protein
VVDDVITGLARISSLFVIARNSTFPYKGRAVDVKQVGRELGVRYVVEGSGPVDGPPPHDFRDGPGFASAAMENSVAGAPLGLAW